MSKKEKPGVLEYRDARNQHRRLLVKFHASTAVLAKFDNETTVKSDMLGMNWARVPISAVHPGSKLVCDDGFTCMKDHAVRTVWAAPNGGGLYVRCDDGQHFLDGQESDDGVFYVGFWFKGDEPPKVP